MTVFLSFACGILCAVQGVSLPPHAENAIEVAVARYRAWKGADETVAFTLVTDVHNHLTVRPERPDFAETRYHVLFAQAAAHRADCDFLADLGDMDFENRLKSADEVEPRFRLAEEVYRDYRAKPVLFCLGNHDHGPLEKSTGLGPITNARFGEAFNGLMTQHGFAPVFGDNKSWGYYDLEAKKFRTIFVNTSDLPGDYGFSSNQLAFVSAALDALPEGWQALVLGHYCVQPLIGHWRGSVPDCPGDAAFVAALERFAARRPGDLVGYFCGDSHFDNAAEWKGVNYTISQGYGCLGEDCVPNGATHIHIGRKDDLLFELVAIKSAKREVRLFRVGSTGPARDRGYRY